MVINYKLLIFIYSPVLLLSFIAIFRDRYEPQNKAFELCNWSLISVICILSFALSGNVIPSFWSYIPILKNYVYTPSNSEMFNFFYYFFLMILVYVFLRYIHKASIIEVFDLKFIHFSFILKLCAVLTLINILSIYFFDSNLMLNPQNTELEYIKSMDMKHIILYCFVTIVFAPVVEESIYRGLLYVPLYRKLGRTIAIILSSLVWTHAHFESLLHLNIGIFIIGIILAWLYDRKGSLITPVIFHMFKNIWIILIILEKG